MRDDPQDPAERIRAGRALLVQPWCPAEADPALFRAIRRHADLLDRWFSQRLGYRLVVHYDTARLVKVGHVPADRPLRTQTGRPFTGQEYTALSLMLAAMASGAHRVSLRDLVLQIRSAAADAGVALDGGAADRRAVVTALRWLIAHGIARELDRTVAGYGNDEGVDALLEIRTDRLTMLPTPALVGAQSSTELLDRATGERTGRAAMRRRIVEDPVLYATEVTAEDWAELRRRIGEESRYLEEMFGLLIEARAEGVAAIDVDGECSDQSFPRGGTVPHAALLLLDALVARHRAGALPEVVDRELADILTNYARYWSRDAVAEPTTLRTNAITLLVAMDLVHIAPDYRVVPQPAAARFVPQVTTPDDHDPEQGTLM